MLSRSGAWLWSFLLWSLFFCYCVLALIQVAICRHLQLIVNKHAACATTFHRFAAPVATRQSAARLDTQLLELATSDRIAYLL